MANQKRKVKKQYKPEDSLKQGKSPKVRKEFIDYDYVDTLSADDAEFLAKFNNEYYGAAVGYNPKTGRAKSGQLHKKKDQIKEIYDNNNRRNNDVLGVTKANILLSDIYPNLDQNDGWYVNDPENTENALIAEIDNDEPQILSFEEYQKVKHNLTMEMLFFYEDLYGDLKESD